MPASREDTADAAAGQAGQAGQAGTPGRDTGPALPGPAPGRERLLLHICCGPCALMPAQRLVAAGYAVTLWYMNPNIHPLTEYLRRRDAAARCAQKLGLPILYGDEAWNVRAWLTAPQARELPPARCHWCCGSRVRAAAAFARSHGFGAFSTSLLYSRYQPHEAIARAGREAAAADGLDFIYADFRVDWEAGRELAKAWDIYRQPYCGCIFSEAERYAKKLARCVAESGA